MSVLTNQAIAFRQLSLVTPQRLLKLQFGSDSERDSSQLLEIRSAHDGEVDGAERAPESEFFLLLKTELEKSAGRAIAR